jgi:hypothetical protein
MQKKKLPVNFEFLDETYGVVYDVYIGDREVCASLVLDKYNTNIIDKENCFGETALIQHGDWIKIVVFLKQMNVYDLVHECLHATSFIMHYIGCDLTEETNEQYAYYISYLTRKIAETYKERVKNGTDHKK